MHRHDSPGSTASALALVLVTCFASGCSSEDGASKKQPNGPYESPTVLATGLGNPRELWHDGGTLFFLANEPGGDYAVMSLSAQGGTPVQLATSVGRALALGGQALYWLGADGLYTVPENGGSPGLVTSDLPFASLEQIADIAADATAVYWSEQQSEGFGPVRAFTLGSAGPVDLTPGSSSPNLLTIDANTVYYLTGAVHSIPKTGGTDVTLATLPGITDGLAVDDGYVYWASLGLGGSISRVSKSGGDVEVLFKGVSHPRSVAVDATHVYFTAQGEGTVSRIAKTGGPRELLAVDQNDPIGLALSEDRVFWADVTAGTISSVSK